MSAQTVARRVIKLQDPFLDAYFKKMLRFREAGLPVKTFFRVITGAGRHPQATASFPLGRGELIEFETSVFSWEKEIAELLKTGMPINLNDEFMFGLNAQGKPTVKAHNRWGKIQDYGAFTPLNPGLGSTQGRQFSLAFMGTPAYSQLFDDWIEFYRHSASFYRVQLPITGFIGTSRETVDGSQFDQRMFSGFRYSQKIIDQLKRWNAFEMVLRKTLEAQGRVSIAGIGSWEVDLGVKKKIRFTPERGKK